MGGATSIPPGQCAIKSTLAYAGGEFPFWNLAAYVMLKALRARTQWQGQAVDALRVLSGCMLDWRRRA
ncbi:MAG: hypothetical protein Rhims3KO_36150 [Hyphomicrobiales bacterium]